MAESAENRDESPLVLYPRGAGVASGHRRGMSPCERRWSRPSRRRSSAAGFMSLTPGIMCDNARLRLRSVDDWHDSGETSLLAAVRGGSSPTLAVKTDLPIGSRVSVVDTHPAFTAALPLAKTWESAPPGSLHDLLPACRPKHMYRKNPAFSRATSNPERSRPPEPSRRPAPSGHPKTITRCSPPPFGCRNRLSEGPNPSSRLPR